MKIKRIRKLEELSFTSHFMESVMKHLQGIASLKAEGETFYAQVMSGMDAQFARIIRFLTSQGYIKIREPALQRFFYRP